MKSTNPGAGPKSSGADSGAKDEQLKSKVEQDAVKLKDSVKNKARDAATQAEQRADKGVNSAASTVDELSEVMESTAAALSEQDKQGMADYATKLADSMSNLSTHLRERSIEDLTKEARGIARDNPTAFLLGSVAIGFGLSRFLKASDSRDAAERNEDDVNAQTQGGTTQPKKHAEMPGVTARASQSRTTPAAERSTT